MDLQFELLFSLAVIAALYGSVGHGGASGYLAVLSLSIFASQGAIWLNPMPFVSISWSLPSVYITIVGGGFLV